MSIAPLIPGGPSLPPASREGPLAAITVAVKDVIDVAGVPTGAGNPSWRAAARPADHDALCVAALRMAGVQIVGKSVTDEFAYSMQGTNAHYGTPANPRWPDRVPGGSSSGSASATAAGLVEVGLGTDTAGSIRVPAAYCGLFGMRPTHGAIDVTGVLPLAPSFDTVGWLARDIATVGRVGDVLLPPATASATAHRVIVAADALALCSPAARAAVTGLIERIGIPARIEDTGLWSHPTRIAKAYAHLSMIEIWQSWGPWLLECRPELGTGVAQRFCDAQRTAAYGLDPTAVEFRRALAQRAHELLAGGDMLVVPATAYPAPLRSASHAQLTEVRSTLLQLCGVVGLAGLPAVVVPVAPVDGLPYGVCFIGGRGRDRDLIDSLAAIPQEQRPQSWIQS